MTFNPNADVSGNRAKRRGRNAAIAGGGAVGLGGIAVLLISMFTGVDLSGLFGGGTGLAPGAGAQGGGTAIEECETGADANERDDCRLAAGTLALDGFWAETLEGYREPTFIVVDSSTPTPCGTASNATGPFYCPADETVYIDPTFFGLLREQFGAEGGALSQLYVLAHEYGHHVQKLIGNMDRYPNNGSGPESNGVRMELQADCFAGAWVAAMTQQVDANGVPYLLEPTDAQIADALNAAATVGDDHIQSQSGAVNPETWTHGSSEQRQRWFETGRAQGVNACDTFSVPGSQL